MGRYYKGTQPVFIEGNIYQPPFEAIAGAIQSITLGIEQNKRDIYDAQDSMQGVLGNVFSFDRDETKKIIDEFNTKITSQAELLQKDPLGSFRKKGDLEDLKRSISKEFKFGKISKNIQNKAILDAWEKKEMERVGAEKNGITYDDIKMAKYYMLQNMEKAGGTQYNPETGEYNSVSSYLEPLISTPDFNKIVQEAIKNIGTTKRTQNFAGTNGTWMTSGTNSDEYYNKAVLYNAAKMALQSDPGVQAYLAQKKKFGAIDEYGAYAIIEREAMEASGSKYIDHTERGNRDLKLDPILASTMDEEKRKRLIDYEKKVNSIQPEIEVRNNLVKPEAEYLKPFGTIDSNNKRLWDIKAIQEEMVKKYFDGDVKKAKKDEVYKKYEREKELIGVSNENARRTVKLIDSEFSDYLKTQFDEGKITKKEYEEYSKKGFLGTYKTHKKNTENIPPELDINQVLGKSNPFYGISNLYNTYENAKNTLIPERTPTNVLRDFHENKKDILFKSRPEDYNTLNIELKGEDGIPNAKIDNELAIRAHNIRNNIDYTDVYIRDAFGKMITLDENKKGSKLPATDFKQKSLYYDREKNITYRIGELKNGKEVYISNERFPNFDADVKKEFLRQNLEEGPEALDPIRNYASQIVENRINLFDEVKQTSPLEAGLPSLIMNHVDKNGIETALNMGITHDGKFYFVEDINNISKRIPFYDKDKGQKQEFFNKLEAKSVIAEYLRTNTY